MTHVNQPAMRTRTKMQREPLAIPLKTAAELLSIKDIRTVVKYGREGRIVIVGTGNGQKVVMASIHRYLQGESEWHAKSQNQSQHAANQAPARSASRVVNRG